MVCRAQVVDKEKKVMVKRGVPHIQDRFEASLSNGKLDWIEQLSEKVMNAMRYACSHSLLHSCNGYGT
jgi:hypothetical protein